MDFIKSIAFVAISFFTAYLTYIIFTYVTPWLMNLGWIWLLIVLLLLGSTAVFLIGFLPRLISKLSSNLKASTSAEGVVIALIAIGFALASIYTAWIQGQSYGLKKIVAAIGQNLIVISVFSGLYKSMIRK